MEKRYRTFPTKSAATRGNAQDETGGVVAIVSKPPIEPHSQTREDRGNRAPGLAVDLIPLRSLHSGLGINGPELIAPRRWANASFIHLSVEVGGIAARRQQDL